MTSLPPTRASRARRTTRNMRPFARAMLMTTAVAWSIGTRVPAPEDAATEPAQSISANDGERSPADGPPRLVLVSRDGQGAAQRPGA